MIPLGLTIENFMNHRKSEIQCTGFNSALIVGRKKDNEHESNGVGKTTIFSAIQYALFGIVPTSTLDKVVREGAEKARVTFDFELPNRGRYRIIRSRVLNKRSDLLLYEEIDGKWASISGRSPSATDRKLAEIIKITPNAFKFSALFAQSDLAGLSEPDKIKGGRIKILEEPLNIVKYTKLKEIAEKKTRPLKHEIEVLESSIAGLGNPAEEMKVAKSDLEYNHTLIKEKETQIDKLKTSIKEKQDAIADLKRSIGGDDSGIHDQIASLEQRSKRLEGFIDKSETTFNEYRKDFEHKKNKIKRLKGEIEELEEKKKDLLEQKVSSKEDLAKKLDKVCADELYGTGILAEQEADYRAADRSIPKEDVCTVCEQAITEEYRKSFEKRTRTFLDQQAGRIEDTKNNLSICRKIKTKVQKEIEDITAHEAKVVSVDTNIKALTSKREFCIESIEGLPQKIEESEKELDSFRNEYKEVLQRLNVLRENAKKSSVSSTNKKIFVLTDELSVYEKSLDTAIEAVSEAKNKQGRAQERIKNAQESLEKLKKYKIDLEDKQGQYRTRRLVIGAFGSEIPRFIIHTILDELQIESNKLLGELRPELGLQFSEALDITYTYNGRPRDYDQLSGGQKVYIAFSLKLGLAKVIQHHIGVDIQFLLLDEVDQSFDKAGADAFAEIVHKFKNKFLIFAITHNEHLKDKFSHAILVEQDGDNGSTSSVVTTW